MITDIKELPQLKINEIYHKYDNLITFDINNSMDMQKNLCFIGDDIKYDKLVNTLTICHYKYKFTNIDSDSKYYKDNKLFKIDRYYLPGGIFSLGRTVYKFECLVTDEVLDQIWDLAQENLNDLIKNNERNKLNIIKKENTLLKKLNLTREEFSLLKNMLK